mgnify:FL=1
MRHLTIGKAEAVDFNETLLHYYDTANPDPLMRCLDRCIKTLDPISRIKSDAGREAADRLRSITPDPAEGRRRSS